jgi:phosphorylase kinase alpha/beta subunit
MRHSIKLEFSLKAIYEITALLQQNQTFYFPILNNGLFSAANIQNEDYQYTGYSNVWVRDNAYIAFAHYIHGHHKEATHNIKTLMRYFYKHRQHFEKIIAGKWDYNDPMNRPYIRFKGKNLAKINEQWAHAQNDALGYFLWFYCKLCNEGLIIPSQQNKKLLALFPLYFDTIQFWQDEDSGHWEEIRKISASSIGVATAALQEYKNFFIGQPVKQYTLLGKLVTLDLLNKLITKGHESLQTILPFECIQNDLKKKRDYDAALLFLIYPMEIVTDEMADRILNNVVTHLQGEYGIRRYLGDSFWSANYKSTLKPDERTGFYGDEASLAQRDSLLKAGEEAQWCIFDPIISVIYGKRFQARHNSDDLAKQQFYLNRSLGQITDESCLFGAFKCPELYYLENGNYVPNDVTPLLWTQANLWVALKVMEDSLKLNQ